MSTDMFCEQGLWLGGQVIAAPIHERGWPQVCLSNHLRECAHCAQVEIDWSDPEAEVGS